MKASHSHPETVALIERCRSGDRESVEALARRFYPNVFRMVRARMGPILSAREGVEDLVQDTFLQVLEGLPSLELRPDAHFIAYLAKVAHGTVVNRIEYHTALKREAARDRTLQSLRAALEESSFDDSLAASASGPATHVERKDLQQLLDDCVSALPEGEREVILLRDYAGADWEFICEQIDRPTRAAAQQLHRRARGRLREAMARRLR